MSLLRDPDTGHLVGIEQAPVKSASHPNEYPKWVEVSASHVIRQKVEGLPDQVSVLGDWNHHTNRVDGKVMVLVENEEAEKAAAGEYKVVDPGAADKATHVDDATRREVVTDLAKAQAAQAIALADKAAAEHAKMVDEEAARRAQEKQELAARNREAADRIAAESRERLSAIAGIPVTVGAPALRPGEVTRSGMHVYVEEPSASPEVPLAPPVIAPFVFPSAPSGQQVAVHKEGV